MKPFGRVLSKKAGISITAAEGVEEEEEEEEEEEDLSILEIVMTALVVAFGGL